MSSSNESSFSVERSSHPQTKVTKVFKGHIDLVESVAYFPDGRHIASGSMDETIRIWNVESGEQEGEALEHESEVKAIAIAPDGRKIAGRVVGALIVWDMVTRKRVREVKIDDEEQDAWALMVAFSPGGRCIATASSIGTSIQLWDVDTGGLVGELQQDVDVVWCLSFSPDGARIATGSSGGSFRVLDTSTGTTLVGPIQGHADTVNSLVYSPDSRLLVTASQDGCIRVWDAATGREVGIAMLSPRGPMLMPHIAITMDGKRIASTSSDDSVRLWSLETRLQVGDPFDRRASHWTSCSVAFSPNGRFIIDGGTPDVNLWDTAAVLDSAVSSPATSNLQSSRSIVPSAHVTTRPSPPVLQQKQTASKAHRDTSSLSSSILDLPAVVQPKPEHEAPRAPSIDDWDSFQPHRQPTAEPTETQQEPRAEPENLNTPPSATDNQWTRIIRRPWRRLRSRKPRVQVQKPQDSSHSPSEEHPTPRKHSGPGPATDPSVISTRDDPTGDETHMGNPAAQKQPLMRFWNRLRRSGAPRDESVPRIPKQPTPGVVDVAGGRDKVRLIMSPDTEEYGVPPPEPVELPPIASRPPSFFEIEVDPSKGWSWSRELCELICCYWCFPRNARPV